MPPCYCFEFEKKLKNIDANVKDKVIKSRAYLVQKLFSYLVFIFNHKNTT
jgi:hypothetical protein